MEPRRVASPFSSLFVVLPEILYTVVIAVVVSPSFPLPSSPSFSLILVLVLHGVFRFPNFVVGGERVWCVVDVGFCVFMCVFLCLLLEL